MCTAVNTAEAYSLPSQAFVFSAAARWIGHHALALSLVKFRNCLHLFFTPQALLFFTSCFVILALMLAHGLAVFDLARGILGPSLLILLLL